jgi:hypothetical protein
MPKKILSFKPMFESNQKLVTKFFNMVQLGQWSNKFGQAHKKKSHCINGGNQTNVDPMIKFFLARNWKTNSSDDQKNLVTQFDNWKLLVAIYGDQKLAPSLKFVQLKKNYH